MTFATLKQLFLAFIAFLETEAAEQAPAAPTIAQEASSTPPMAPASPAAQTPPPGPPVDPDSFTYPWDSPAHNWHNVRVLCDKRGLPVGQKDLICACVFQESQFNNHAIHENKDNQTGQLWSTDWGIVQVNDFYHCGPGKEFPSAAYVVANPEAAVDWMITMYLNGRLSAWASYSTGAYRQWLKSTSPMWALATQ
jgi:hypothetical protein